MKENPGSVILLSMVVICLQGLCVGQDGRQQDARTTVVLNHLLGNKQIQEEVELTQSQVKELRTIHDALDKKIAPLQAKAKKLSDKLSNEELDEQQIAKATAELKQVQEKLKLNKTNIQRQFDDVLLPHQKKTLYQAIEKFPSEEATQQNQSVLMSEHLIGALDDVKPDAQNAYALNLLLNNTKIQNEIELDRSQLEALRKIREAIETETRPLHARARKLTGELRSDGRDEDQVEAVSDDLNQVQEELIVKLTGFYKQADKVLLPDQMKRLNQTVTQYRLRGATQQNQSVLMSEHLVGALGITSEQRNEMQEIAKEAQRELEEIIAKHRQETHNDLLKVLDEKQRNEFEDLFGKKIDF